MTEAEQAEMERLRLRVKTLEEANVKAYTINRDLLDEVVRMRTVIRRHAFPLVHETEGALAALEKSVIAVSN